MAGVSYLSATELYLIMLQCILMVGILKGEILGSFYSLNFMIFIVLMTVEVYITIKRVYKDKIKYPKRHKFIYYSKSVIVLLFITSIMSYMFFKSNEIIIVTVNIIVVLCSLLLIIISYIHLKWIIKILFYSYMKYRFPLQEEDIYKTEYSLRTLSRYIPIEKQKVHTVLTIGIKGTLYGFYIYFILFVFSFATFEDTSILSTIKEYINELDVVSFSNLLGLGSIELTLLTICIPILIKIEREAEKKLIENSRT